MKNKAKLFIMFFAAMAPQLVLAGSVNYQYPAYRELIGRHAAKGLELKTKRPLIGITSHHLPTASPLLDNFYLLLKKQRPDIKTFVVVGPDHFERCRRKFVVSDSLVKTMFGEIKIDQSLLKDLTKAGPVIENDCFHGEHAIGVEANYIKKYFPEAQILPMLLSYAARNRNFYKTIAVLKKHQNNIFVLESTDFTHYVNARQANANDEISRRLINSLDGRGFTLKQVDSPGTIKLILQLAKELKLKPEIIEHKNSFDYTGAFENTTSYFSVVF